MTVVLDLNSIAQISAARLVDCLVGGALITAFAELLLRLARRQAAATRFAIWFGALMAIASLALVGTGSWNHSRPLAVCTGTGHAVFTASTHWAMFIFTMWAGIAVIGLVRVGFGLGQLYRLRRSCVPVDLESLDPQVRESLNQHAQKRSVGLGTSERVPAPTAVGLWRPAVVIPVWVMQDLSSAELNQVLLHELAHLRRHDDWTNLAQKIVKALLFFHPAVWWIERNASLEREMACDDAVLGETLAPRAYAECLAHLAENSLVRRSLALAQGALGRVHQVS